MILPGYFRATKNWDVLVVHRRRLIAVLEFKSQVGSFGNNLNNRSEEVVGSAADLWVAHEHGAFSDEPASGISPGQPPGPEGTIGRDPRPPFLGWLMLLEECPRSMQPVKVDEPHFGVSAEFRGASYARRYRILCERLVERKLYSAAALVLTDRASGSKEGAFTSLSDATSLPAMFSELAGRLLAAASP